MTDLDPRTVDGGIRTTTAPFDAIRITTLEGREYWSARDLMPLLGYEKWERFADAISRAKVAAYNAGSDVAQNFPAAGKVSGSRGPDQADYHLSRYACYLVAMNGDPRKQEIANAQTYFAIKTREAEAAPARELTDDELIHRALTVSARRVEELTAKVAELEPSAAAWTELADAAGDWSVSDAAKVLSRDPNISIGRDRLFQAMHAWHWVYRPRGCGWRAYQDQVDNGRLVEKLAKPYYHQGRDEIVTGEPTVRITTKGIESLQKRLGGGGGQLTLAVAE